jgi:hypothetical protein
MTEQAPVQSRASIRKIVSIDNMVFDTNVSVGGSRVSGDVRQLAAWESGAGWSLERELARNGSNVSGMLWLF